MLDLKQTLEHAGGRRERDRDQRVRVVAATALIVDPSPGSSPISRAGAVREDLAAAAGVECVKRAMVG